MIVPLTDTFALTVPIVLESGNRAVTHSPNLNFLTIIHAFVCPKCGGTAIVLIFKAGSFQILLRTSGVKSVSSPIRVTDYNKHGQ